MSLLRLLTAVALLTLTAEAATDPGDAVAMHVLAKSIGADSSLNWSPTSDPCTQWPGVHCGGGKVTAIQIGEIHNLSGTVPPEVGNLTSLQRLELQSLGLGGPLPSLAGLSALSALYLHDNQFSSIPSDFFSGLVGLTAVTLDENPFAPWPIPISLKDCSSLLNFSAINASVTGGVPDFLGTAFTSLDHLALSSNAIGGQIPRSFANSGVKSLWLNGAGLSGGVDMIANMTSLKVVFLQSNSLTGPLPDLSMVDGLQMLNLRDNQITGPVPESLMRLKSLQSVVLTNNLLQGPVPVFDAAVKLDLKPETESFCLDTAGDCDPRVNVLLSIAGAFGYPARFAHYWKGNDPCANWMGISCDESGNVTMVNFQKMGLTGFISPEFGSLGSLQKLILSNNHLTGTIPPELVNLKLLKVLDVSNNSLSGEVPRFSNVQVNTDGNPDIGKDIGVPPGGSPPGGWGSSPSGDGGSGGKSNAGVIVGCVVGGIVVIGIVGLLAFCYLKKKKMKEVKSDNKVPVPSTLINPRRSGSDVELLKFSENSSAAGSGPVDIQVVEPVNLVISIHVLRAVTNNFNEANVLGRGGFGTVYGGKLQDTMIAVKRMEPAAMGSKGLNEFKSEISVLTKVRHRHLVSLLGYCLEDNERILVYEYMPQGTLSHHLFDWVVAKLKPLDWKMRLNIALDVARGVEYLHSLMNESFIHRDLKPSNILLGDNMRAKVADFGLVRLAPEGKQCSVETRVAGTFGYLAPEYAVTGRVTTKADVFSFGVILMELITGRKALDNSRDEESAHLVTWFKRMQIKKEFPKAVDPAIDLTDAEISESVNIVSDLAGHCSVRDPHQRPDMSHVVNVLSSLAEKWKPSRHNLDDVLRMDNENVGWRNLLNIPTDNSASVQFGDSMISTDGSIPPFAANINNTQRNAPPNQEAVDGR